MFQQNLIDIYLTIKILQILILMDILKVILNQEEGTGIEIEVEVEEEVEIEVEDKAVLEEIVIKEEMKVALGEERRIKIIPNNWNEIN